MTITSIEPRSEVALPASDVGASSGATPEGSCPVTAVRPTRRHLLRGGAIAALGASIVFLLAAHDARLRFGVPLGALFVVACAVGVMDLAGSFAPGSRTASSVAARALAWPLARVASCGALSLLSLWSGVHAIVPQLVAGAGLAAGVVGFAAAVFALGIAVGPFRLDESGRERSLLRRQGFWLIVAMALLYLPTLGAGSLTDPWETHYGEVAREVIARDDWISLWWSWQGFFYSKPVLGIWLQSIAMATLGVHVAPDQMLQGVAGRLAHPEWAVRAPFALFAMAGTYLLYTGVARWLGRRAAFLGAIALATSPHWFLVAHQSMTDMPYVASLAGAIGLVLLAARVDDAALAAGYEVRFGARAVRLDAWHLLFTVILACAVPQIVYLFSRNLELVLHAAGPHGFRPHLDDVLSGSGLGNCGQPGDEACGRRAPGGRLEPWVQAIGWTALLVGLVATCRGERRLKRLLYLGAWLLAALATMAKGPAGLAIPAASVLVWLCATRRFGEIPRAALGAGAMVVALVVGPWILAVYVRHGSPFTDELFFNDMFNRAFSHVHDTNVGADTSLTYYLGQLGYGLFPWTALAPLGLFAWGRGKRDANDAVTLLVLWFLVAFALFTMMGTKFHHYILPAVPPAAMLAGVALDALLGGTQGDEPHARAMIRAAALGGAMVLALVARDLVADPGGAQLDGAARFMQLFTYRYDRPWPASLSLHAPIVATACVGAAALASLAIPRARAVGAGAWVALAVGWCAWGLDVYLPRASFHWGQRAVIGAYYTDRAGPSEPIAAYQMNWKGENFYTSNHIPQFGTPTVPPGTPAFASWVESERHKGTRVAYFVTERSRIGGLRNEVKPRAFREVTSPEDCGQFVLVRAEL
jgi:4-amino-4-deoxy-L-arabinose transferase-like glycosyltransferase